MTSSPAGVGGVAGPCPAARVWSSPARRSAFESSAFLPKIVRMGLRPLEMRKSRFRSKTLANCKNEFKFLNKNFGFIAKFGVVRHFSLGFSSKLGVAAGSASASPSLASESARFATFFFGLSLT